MPRDAQKRKCNQLTKSGRPCTRWAITGSMVCNVHGGQLPVVQAAARKRRLLANEEIMDRLRELVDPALKALEEIILDETGSIKPETRMKAADTIFARFAPVRVDSKVEISTDELRLDEEIDEVLGEGWEDRDVG
jgi:hypothetical protein